MISNLNNNKELMLTPFLK